MLRLFIYGFFHQEGKQKGAQGVRESKHRKCYGQELKPLHTWWDSAESQLPKYSTTVSYLSFGHVGYHVLDILFYSQNPKWVNIRKQTLLNQQCFIYF